MLLDYYGNIIKDFEIYPYLRLNPEKEVYEFVLSELNDIKDIVRDDVSSESYESYKRCCLYITAKCI